MFKTPSSFKCPERKMSLFNIHKEEERCPAPLQHKLLNPTKDEEHLRYSRKYRCISSSKIRPHSITQLHSNMPKCC